MLHGHKSFVLWLTGLSGSGKTTLANAIEEKLNASGISTIILDGDNVRHGLCSDLGFSAQDRVENIRRTGEVAKLFLEAGIVTIVAFISPYEKDRARVRSLLSGDFIEIYCHCDLSVCESRDVKGLYNKARLGEIKNFTGIDSPYESPIDPEIRLETGSDSLQSCVEDVFEYLVNNKRLEYVEI